MSNIVDENFGCIVYGNSNISGDIVKKEDIRFVITNDFHFFNIYKCK